MLNVFKKPTNDQLLGLDEIVSMYEKNINVWEYLSIKLKLHNKKQFEELRENLNKNYTIAKTSNLMKFKMITSDLITAKRESDQILVKFLDLYEAEFKKTFHVSEMNKCV